MFFSLFSHLIFVIKHSMQQGGVCHNNWKERSATKPLEKKYGKMLSFNLRTEL